MALALDVAKYAAAHARVRGLWAQILDSETWQGLIEADSLATVYSLLQGTVYADVLEGGEGEGAGIEGVEHRLLGKAAANCRKCMTFLLGASRTLLLVWWQHFELENLKALFRGTHQNISQQLIASYLIPLGDYSTLPWDALLSEHSVQSLIARLDGTHYINPLRNALSAYERERSTFPLEVALDIRYYRDIAAAIKELGSGERSEARSLLGTYVDMLNLLWAYRYRVYYGLSAEEIINYTLWHTFRTDVELVRTIALGASPIEIVPRVWGPQAVDLSGLESAQDEAEMMPGLELALLRYWRRLGRRQLAGFPFRLGPILAYLILEELEAQDLVRILEGKSLGWKPEAIRAYLIRAEG